MKPTEMPAFRLTGSCIWNSFRISGKRHLLLTGGRGAGKTTLLGELFSQKQPGITTFAEPKKAVYLSDNRTGETVRIAVYDDTLPGTDKKMILCGDGLISHGLPILERCATENSEWITVDEIGYVETGCESYLDALRRLFKKKRVAAVVRKQELPFVRELCDSEDVFVVDLDQPFGDYGCVIMASGLGKRFGGNKLMTDFAGAPMISRILDATEGLFAKRVVVTRHADVASLCREKGIDVVVHDFPHRSDTVRLGLEAMGDTAGCMFCPADQPLLRWETVASLLLSAVNASDPILRPCFEKNPGAPVLFPKWTFSELATLPEGKGGGFVVQKHPDRVWMLPVQDPFELADADTPELLEQLQRRYEEKKKS